MVFNVFKGRRLRPLFADRSSHFSNCRMNQSILIVYFWSIGRLQPTPKNWRCPL